MTQIVEIIIIIASVITALGTIIACFSTIHKWVLRQNKQDEDIRSIKDEQKILTTGVLACLKGLKEQGCDGPVTEAITSIENHLNKEAHK
ncbi:MAG: branched-chain amino acid ABC transporter permease [Bacilli bacterium]|nr:branched-chain amino acid ABC transporter permease [Bacilli bacterium]